jgi:hypothetical protein
MINFSSVNRHRCHFGFQKTYIGAWHLCNLVFNPSQEEAFLMGVVEESALHNGVRIIEEDKVEQGELKNKYKISLTRNRQLVVYGYHYVLSPLAMLYCISLMATKTILIVEREFI